MAALSEDFQTRLVFDLTGASQQVNMRLRRVGDRVLAAFYQACVDLDLETADRLLQIAEAMMQRSCRISMQEVRRGMERLVAAHSCLWHLRNPSDIIPTVGPSDFSSSGGAARTAPRCRQSGSAA